MRRVLRLTVYVACELSPIYEISRIIDVPTIRNSASLNERENDRAIRNSRISAFFVLLEDRESGSKNRSGSRLLQLPSGFCLEIIMVLLYKWFEIFQIVVVKVP